MPNTLQIRRGLQSALPTGIAGELLFATDTKRFYISDGSATNLLQGAATLLTTGAIPFSDANGKLTMSASNLYWDNTNARLGIGTASPANQLSVVGSRAVVSITDSFSGGTNPTFFGAFADFLQLSVNRNPSTGTYAQTGKASSQISLEGGVSSGTIRFYNTNTNNTQPTETLRLFGTGNLLLQTGGTFTDAGYKLDVNGTARVSGDITLGGWIRTPQTGNLIVNVGNFALQLTSNNPQNSSGSLITTGDITRTDSGTKNIINVNNLVSSTAASFNVLNGYAFTSTITQTQGTIRGIYIAPTLTASTDFRAIEITSGISILAPSRTQNASLRIPSGTAPTSPVNGDIWFDGTLLKMQIGGVTKTFTLL